ncbi:MAG: PAS domain S-box protein [Planctomycetes bacterium]|nr:PAS domain S-box protein [Planctomycetota bacterium]
MDSPDLLQILIIEDEPDIASMYKMLLKGKFPASVEIAGDCASAREKFASATFDIITLDYQLPDGDGLELLREIRAMYHTPPVVMVTGHGDERTAVESFKLGASGYVVKDKRLSSMLPDAVYHALSEVAPQRSEEALLNSEIKYRSLIEGLGETVYRMKLPGGEYEYFGPSAKDVFGYTAEEFIDDPMLIRDIIHPDSTEYFNEKWSELAGGRVSNAYEYKIVDPNGEERWIVQSNRGVFDDDGRIIAIEGICRDITERKRAEGTLERYRSMVESAHDAIFFKDLQSRYLVVNDKTLEAFGASLEDVIGKNDFEIMPDEDEARQNVKDDQSVFDTGKSEEFVKHMTSTTGEDFWFHAVKVPAFDDSGEVIGLVGVARDITDQKRMEDRLRRSEEYFRALIENVQDVVSILDRDGTIRYISGSAEEAFGYTPEELIGTSPFEHVDPDQVEEMAGIFAREIGNPGGALSVEFRYQHKDGTWREYESICHNLIDNPAVEGVVLVSRDITERKRAEEELVLAKDYTENIIRSLVDTLILVDPEANIKTVNSETCKLLGYSEDELIGNPVSMIFAEEEEEEEEVSIFKGTRLTELIKEGSIRNCDMTYKTKSGEEIPVSFSGSAMRDKEGELIGIVGIARDMREIKRLMQKEKELVAAERKRADELKQAEEELQRINAELEGFAHTVSHDLRGPLTVISLAVDMLGQSVEGLKSGSLESIEAVDEIAATLGKNAKNAHRLIKDLLSLAKSGQVPGEVSAVDMADLVEEILRECSSAVREKGVEVKVSPDLGSVTANRTQMFQLFSNLIRNAIEHSSNQRPVVEVSYLGYDGSGGHQYLVRDNGGGIPEDIIERVFTPFVKGEGGGTGIGLSIAEKITGVYGGKIRAYNDNGACFEFTIRDFQEDQTS